MPPGRGAFYAGFTGKLPVSAALQARRSRPPHGDALYRVCMTFPPVCRGRMHAARGRLPYGNILGLCTRYPYL